MTADEADDVIACGRPILSTGFFFRAWVFAVGCGVAEARSTMTCHVPALALRRSVMGLWRGYRR